MERLILWGVGRYLGGRGRPWLFTALAVFGYRAVRSTMGRKKVIDIGSVAKGQKIVIEHLEVTHEQQLKDEKLAKRAAKREKRAARKAMRAAGRERRAAAKSSVGSV